MAALNEVAGDLLAEMERPVVEVPAEDAGTAVLGTLVGLCLLGSGCGEASVDREHGRGAAMHGGARWSARIAARS